MDQNQTKSKAKDFFINLGATISLYTVVVSLVNLLFTIINSAYPQITSGYYYGGSGNVSWPVAVLVIFFPILILLMWLMEKQYVSQEKSNVHKWLSYITLFISGLVMAGDLITVLYYFIDGQELTIGFLLKILVLLVVSLGIFMYYISDIRNKLTSSSRKIWRIVTLVIVVGSIVWGFSVLGSPRTQRLFKYDEQKVNDLMNIDSNIQSFYSQKGILPKTLDEMSASNYYVQVLDQQSQKPYEYQKTGNTTYSLCAEFNKATKDATSPNIYARPVGYQTWQHNAGHTCFSQTINPNLYNNKVPPPVY